MKSDAELRSEVTGSLFQELRVDDLEIAVFVVDGTATLRGTVGSPGAKLAAGRAARRVRGVRRVENDLDVRPTVGRHHDDAELRGSVLRALSWDVSLPATVDASVDDGVVTLTGTVASQHLSVQAEEVARKQFGVTDVDNRITVA